MRAEAPTTAMLAGLMRGVRSMARPLAGQRSGEIEDPVEPRPREIVTAALYRALLGDCGPPRAASGSVHCEACSSFATLWLIDACASRRPGQATADRPKGGAMGIIGKDSRLIEAARALR